MSQAVTSSNINHKRITFYVIKSARNGDVEAMKLIERHFEPYIKRLATVDVCGISYLNTDLYDRLKTRLIMATLKFRL